MPALRELKKSPHARMRSGAGQAGAFEGGVIQRAGCGGTMTSQGRTVNYTQREMVVAQANTKDSRRSPCRSPARHAPKGKPRAEGNFDAGSSSMRSREDKHSAQQLCACYGSAVN